MYTFLVVDDESLVRENIVYLLRQSRRYPFQILEAEDGDTAMEILKSHQVDILLLDVQMLRVSGLQLMDWLYETKWEGQYAVISGYSNFAYVHRALEKGAANYILKPIDEEQFFPVMDSLLDMVEQRKEERQMRNRYHRQLAENYWLRVERCFIKGLENSWSASLTREYAELGGEGNPPVRMCVLLCNADAPGITREELLATLCGKAVKLANNPKWLGFIRNHRSDHEALLLQRAPADDDFFTEFWECVRQTAGGGQLSAAATAVEGGVSSLPQAYRHCHVMLKQRFLIGRGWMPAVPETKQIPQMEKADLLDRLRHSLHGRSLQNMQAVHALLCEIFCADTFEKGSLAFLRELFRQTAAVICDEAKAASQKYTDVRLEHFDSIAEVTDYFAELIRGLFMPENEGGSFREYYRPICAYIAEHFQEPITLTELAGQFQFHPNYFSGAFREMAGVSFQDYVTALRLKEAKALLCGSGLSVRQIALQVGYHSQSYFQRVFKKAENLTPMEYRLAVQREAIEETPL